MSGYYEGTLDVGCANNGGMGFGGNGWGDLAALIVVAGLFGWGNGGFGGFGGGRGGVGENYVLQPTSQPLSANLTAWTTVCDGFYAQNTNMLTGFNGIQQTLCQGFNGIRSFSHRTAYQNQARFNALAQLAQCCCDVRTELMQNRYLNEKQTCEIIRRYQRRQPTPCWHLPPQTSWLPRMLESRLLKAQISNAEQSAYLLNELKPCPKAAYVVQPATTCDFPH